MKYQALFTQKIKKNAATCVIYCNHDWVNFLHAAGLQICLKFGGPQVSHGANNSGSFSEMMGPSISN